jgi:hypothetical protein
MPNQEGCEWGWPSPFFTRTQLLKMVTPLKKMKIVKKRTKHFDRHQSDTKMAVKPSWRRPKGGLAGFGEFIPLAITCGRWKDKGQRHEG